MRHPSIFVAVATKQDQLTGEEIAVTYHPDGHVTSRDHTGRELPLPDPGCNLTYWVTWMRKNKYLVDIRDARLEEIQRGVALS